MRIGTAMLVCLLAVGCEARRPAPTGGGGEAVPEGCPESDGPFVRGRVLVPDRRADGDAGSVDDRRRELPARDTPVVVANGGEPVETTTDANGRWCLDIDDRETSMELVARATVDGTELRRPVVTRDGQIISVRSEAVVRLLSERIGELASVPPAVFLNLEAIASTATDLLEPVDWRGAESVAVVVEKVVERIEEDPRFSETLKRLETRNEK